MYLLIRGITFAAVLYFAVTFVQPVKATISDIRSETKQIKEERVEARKEFRQEIQTSVDERKSSISSALSKRVLLSSATLTAKSGDTFTVTKDSKSYSVLTNSETQLRRRFWGKATLDEMQVGDSVNIIGVWTDDTKTTIQARLVRDISIQKRFGIFVGVIKSMSGNTFILEAVQRGPQTVTVDSATKITNRNGQTIPQSDLTVGHRVRVRGMWNNANSTITEVVGIKDYSLPVK